jgi:hypothetical protein
LLERERPIAEKCQWAADSGWAPGGEVEAGDG